MTFQRHRSRFCACVGIEVQICDPHHPQQNGFVERYHRTYHQECLALDHPTTLGQAQTVTEAFIAHYNFQRPHQGLSCDNRPPRSAFPILTYLTLLTGDSGSGRLAGFAGWAASGAQGRSQWQGQH